MHFTHDITLYIDIYMMIAGDAPRSYEYLPPLIIFHLFDFPMIPLMPLS